MLDRDGIAKQIADDVFNFIIDNCYTKEDIKVIVDSNLDVIIDAINDGFNVTIE